jgi:uncharacterized OB-fold protein
VSDRKYYLPEGLPAPAPYPEGLAAEYWDGVQKHELLVQRCTKCQTWQWGPEYICYNCHSFDLGYEKVSGKGKIFSWERSWYPVHPALKDGLPYITVLVELPDAGNVRMVGNLLGDPMQTVNIGADVEAVYEDHEDSDPKFTLVQWKTVD